MANFNLPFGVRVSNNNPLDAERYVVADVTTRDALLSTPVRAYEGLQVYVESEKNLYILKDVDLSTWELVGGGTSYLSTLLDVSIGADISAGYVLVYDPSANDASKWYAVEPINAADIFIPEVSFNDAYFKWVGGLIEPSVQGGGGGGTVGWANDVVGSNNQLLTAAGDGSIVAESHFTFNGSSLVIDADVSILLNSGAGNTKGIQIYWAGVPGTLIDDNQIRCVSTNGDFYIQNGSDTNGNTNIGSLYGRTTILNDACIGGDLFIHGMDNLSSSNIVYVQTDGKLTYSQNNFALDGSILWVLDNSLIYPRNSDHDVQLNAIQIEDDAGSVTIMDMNVTSTPVDNTEESYTFKLDNAAYLTIYSQADGAGGTKHEQVKTSVPLVVNNNAFFSIGDPCTNGSWRFLIDTSGNLSVQKLESGSWVVKGNFV